MFEEKNQPDTSPTSETSEEEIYVMPERFRKGKRRFVEEKSVSQITKPIFKKKGFPLYLLWVFFGLIFVILGGLFYFQPNLIFSLLAPKISPPVINRPIVNQLTINQPIIQPTPQPSPEETIKVEFKKEEETIAQAELYLPQGAVSFGTKLNLEASLPTVESQEKYKIIGPLFKISPLVSLLKPITFKIIYSEKEIAKIWEDDFKIGYLKDNYWIVLPTEVDTENNKLTVQIRDNFPSQIYTSLILKEKTLVQPTEYQEIAPGILSTLDTDKDALTDKEEEIYKTNKNNPDFDGDSYLDGLEIVNLYSPLSGPGDRLATSDLVRIYNNSTYDYSLFYPTVWQVKAMPESQDKEIIFSTETGEFFEVIIEENSEELSPLEWYKKQIKELSTDQIKETEVDGQKAVWSLEGLSLYIGKGNKIYVFTYNIGAEKEANFKSTFLMMIKSFKFLASE